MRFFLPARSPSTTELTEKVWDVDCCGIAGSGLCSDTDDEGAMPHTQRMSNTAVFLRVCSIYHDSLVARHCTDPSLDSPPTYYFRTRLQSVLALAHSWRALHGGLSRGMHFDSPFSTSALVHSHHPAKPRPLALLLHAIYRMMLRNTSIGRQTNLTLQMSAIKLFADQTVLLWSGVLCRHARRAMKSQA